MLLHLARKAFFPSRVLFPLLHIDTTWKFKEMIAFRDRIAREHGFELIVHINQEGCAHRINPSTTARRGYTDIMKTQALLQGARPPAATTRDEVGAWRDEEKSRGPRSMGSSRIATRSMPGTLKNHQRPELWRVFKHRGLAPGESMRVFPTSNWTELEHRWTRRPRREKDRDHPAALSRGKGRWSSASGTLIMIDDDLLPASSRARSRVRRWCDFRTLG